MINSGFRMISQTLPDVLSKNRPTNQRLSLSPSVSFKSGIKLQRNSYSSKIDTSPPALSVLVGKVKQIPFFKLVGLAVGGVFLWTLTKAAINIKHHKDRLTMQVEGLDNLTEKCEDLNSIGLDSTRSKDLIKDFTNCLRLWRDRGRVGQVIHEPEDNLTARCWFLGMSILPFNATYREIREKSLESFASSLVVPSANERLDYLLFQERQIETLFENLGGYTDSQLIELAKSYRLMIDRIYEFSVSQPMSVIDKMEIIKHTQNLMSICSHSDYQFHTWCANQSAEMIRCSENPLVNATTCFIYSKPKKLQEMKELFLTSYLDLKKLPDKIGFILAEPDVVMKDLEQTRVGFETIIKFFLPISHEQAAYEQILAMKLLSNQEQVQLIQKFNDPLTNKQQKLWQFDYAVLGLVESIQAREKELNADSLALLKKMSFGCSDWRLHYKIRMILESIKVRFGGEDATIKTIEENLTSSFLNPDDRASIDRFFDPGLSTNQLWFNHSPHSIFTGGRRDLKQLSEDLKKIRRNPLLNRDPLIRSIATKFNQGKKIIGIWGPVGTGKNIIARMYALKYCLDYTEIIALEGDSKAKLTEELIQKLPVLQQQKMREAIKDNDQNVTLLEEVVQAFLDLYRETEKSKGVLLLIHNINKETEETVRSLQDGFQGNILFTSEFKVDFADIVPVELFSKEEAVSYLLKTTGRSDREEAALLAKELGFLPLSIAHASSFLKNHPGKDFREYYTFLNEQLPKKLQDPKLSGDYFRFVQTWYRNYEAIENSNKLAVDLLATLSHLDPDYMNKQLILDLSRTLSDQEGIDPEIEYVDPLKEYSLINEDEEGFSMHRMDQWAMRVYQRDCLTGLKDATAFLYNQKDIKDFNPFIEKTIPHFRPFAAHCKALFDSTQIYNRMTDLEETSKHQLFYVFNAYGRYLFLVMRDLKEALTWYDPQKLQKRLDLPEEHPLISKIYHHRGLILAKLNHQEPNESDRLALIELEKCEQLLTRIDPEHPAFAFVDSNRDKCSKDYQLAACWLDMARIERKLGLQDQANDHLSQAGQIFENMPAVMFDYGRAIREHAKAVNDREESILILKKALSVLEKAYGANFGRKSTTASVYLDLADNQKKAGRLIDAAHSCHEAIEINQRLDQKEYLSRALKLMIAILKGCEDEQLTVDYKREVFEGWLRDIKEKT